MSAFPDLFTCPSEDISAAALEAFVRNAIATRLQAESLVLEFKSKSNDKNVIHAVAAMSNTAGGLVLVGIDEAAENPCVGLSAGDVDRVAQQLRALLPNALPEMIPVALEATPDRAVLVLRVDADDVDQPVVVDGRVMVRCPGHSVGARRDEVVALVNRQRQSGATTPLMSMDVANTGTWGEDPPPVNEVRVLARLWLPRNVERRGFLGSSAFEAAERALRASPVPNLIGSTHVRDHELIHPNWSASETGSIRATFACTPSQAVHRGHHGYRSIARMNLNGRSLDTLISIVPEPAGGAEPQLDLETLADILVSACWATISAGVATADAIGAARPLSPALLDMWISGPLGPETFAMRRQWAGERHVSNYKPRTARPAGHEISDLVDVTKKWLMPLLLDIGATGFEDDLDGLTKPTWASGIGV